MNDETVIHREFQWEGDTVRIRFVYSADGMCQSLYLENKMSRDIPPAKLASFGTFLIELHGYLVKEGAL